MKMYRKNLIIASAIAVSLSGCALDDAVQTKLGGTGVGAALGGAVGYALGGRDGALIGAALGSGVGYAFGSNIAKRKQSYASREDALNGEIQYYAEYNKSVAEKNKQLAADIATLKARRKSLMAQYKQGKVTRAQVLAQKQSLRNAVNQNEKYLAEINQNYQEGKNYLDNELVGSGANAQKIAKLRREQKRLKQQIAKARKLHLQIAKEEQSISV